VERGKSDEIGSGPGGFHLQGAKEAATALDGIRRIFPAVEIFSAIKGTEKRELCLSRSGFLHFQNQTERRTTMTKSKGVGRGGHRRGAGRKPRAAAVDWNAIARAYFAGRGTVDDICEKFGVSYGDLLTYAAANHWVTPRPFGRHLEDLGDMASALAWALLDERDETIAHRSRRFVGAMVALEVPARDIAAVLHVSEASLRSEFPKELAEAR
jgi:hypothetical protein